MDAFINTVNSLPRGLVYVALGILVILIAKIAHDIITKYQIDEQITQLKNNAVALRTSGYLMAVMIVFLGAVHEPQWAAQTGLGFDREFATQILWTFLYSMAGIAALNAVHIVTDKIVLHEFKVEHEIIEKQNVGVAAVEFGTSIASALVISASISGFGGPLHALAFFALGQATLILFTIFYQFTTPFNIHDELEQSNTAIGIAMGGNLIAIGLIIYKATFGDFFGWTASLASFALYAVTGFVMLYVLRIAVDRLMLPNTKTSQALATDRNTGIAFVESTVVISLSLILLFVV